MSLSLSFSVQHNLLGGGRDPEDGLGPGGASRSHGHDTQAVASSIGLKPKPGGAKNKGKQKASARVVEAAEETKTCTGPLDVDLALGDAFGSPQRIRHRPPKSSGLKRGQRQTLMFDHSRQTWHMPIEVPGARTTTAIFPRRRSRRGRLARARPPRCSGPSRRTPRRPRADRSRRPETRSMIPRPRGRSPRQSPRRHPRSLTSLCAGQSCTSQSDQIGSDDECFLLSEGVGERRL